MSNSTATAQPTQNASVNPTLDYVANDPESQGGDFVEYMAENFDFVNVDTDGHKNVVRKYNAKFKTSFGTWSELASFLYNASLQPTHETAKSEATTAILQAQSVTPTNVELKQAVRGIVIVEKDNTLLRELALKNSPLYASWAKDKKSVKIPAMCYELHTLGFSAKQAVNALHTHDKEPSFTWNVGEAKKTLGLHVVTHRANTGEAKTPTTKRLTVENVETAIKARYTRFERELNALVTNFSNDATALCEKHTTAKQAAAENAKQAAIAAANNAAKVSENARNAMRALPNFANFTDAQLNAILGL